MATDSFSRTLATRALNFQPGGAGQVSRLVGDKLRDALSFGDFGTIGDGIADDTAAVQAFFNFHAASTVINGVRRKRKGFLPSGVYRLTAPITISGTDFEIIGDGSQSTEFLIDHTAGPGFNYTGLGFGLFQGFVIRASATRKASADANLHGFLSDPGPSFTTFKLRFRDVLSLDHPGDCFRLIQPEQLLMRGCAGNRSGQGYGIHVWGRNLVNICGEIIQSDVTDNALNGLYVNQMSAMQIRQIRALNNRGAGGQVRIDGENNTLSDLDCEAFNLIDTAIPPSGGFIGLSITGRCNRVIGGNFYALTKGVRLSNADDCLVFNPGFGGKSASFPMAVGVSLESGSDFNYLKMSSFTGNFVTADYDLAGGINNRVNARGIEYVAVEAHQIIESLGLSGTYTPDAALGSVFRLSANGPLTIAFPTNLKKGQRLKFEISQSGTGGNTITFDPGYNAKFSNIGNAVGLSSSVNFIATGNTTIQQDGAQGLWQREEFGAATVAFGGTTVAAGAVSGIPTLANGSAVLGNHVIVTADVNLQGLRLTAWVSANGTISYQFHNPTTASITIGACNLRFLLKRIG